MGGSGNSPGDCFPDYTDARVWECEHSTGGVHCCAKDGRRIIPPPAGEGDHPKDGGGAPAFYANLASPEVRPLRRPGPDPGQGFLPTTHQKEAQPRIKSGATSSGLSVGIVAHKAGIERVASRAQQGGHDIPEAVIRRRFASGLRNFHHTYKLAVDDWVLYGNSGITPVMLEWGQRQ